MEIDSEMKLLPTEGPTTIIPSNFIPHSQVKGWNAVVFWRYTQNDCCAICHNDLMIPCIQCEADAHRAEECTPSTGGCGHQFHFHCITRWMATRSTCPLDDQEWNFMTM